MSDELKWIVEGSTNPSLSFDGYVINERHFDTKYLDDRKANQNNGISIVAGTMQFFSAKDKNFIYRDMTYYGVVKEIWEHDYHAFWIPIFKCDWVESNNGINIDKLGFTYVNLNKVEYKDDLFILASQANQVFYVGHLIRSGWSIALS